MKSKISMLCFATSVALFGGNAVFAADWSPLPNGTSLGGGGPGNVLGTTNDGRGVALGSGSSAADFGVALGGSFNGQSASAERMGTAVGIGTVASSQAVALGMGARANSNLGVALGSETNVDENADRSVAIGHGAQATEAYTVSFGNSGTKRRLVNVAVGTGDTDAVNVGQMNQQLTQARQYGDQNYAKASNIFGEEGFIVVTPGQVSDQDTSPTVTISTSQALKDAVAGNFNNGLTIAADEKHGEITIKQGDNISMGGNRVKNVGAPKDPGDAVNKAYVDQETRSIRSKIHDMDKDLRAGIAMAIATAGLPQAYMPGKSVLALAGGTYHGQGGFALGLSHATDNRSWVFKGSASVDTRGNFGGSLGAGYQF